MKKITLLVTLIMVLTITACAKNKESENTSTPTSSPQDTNIPLEETKNGDDLEIMHDASSEIIEITSFDGYTFNGKLTIPSGGEISKLVIYVNGSGANTYENRRTGFNYFDTFADEFSKLDIAFFSYNTRGADIGDNPPMFTDIKDEEYQTYLPLNSVEDVYHMIKTIKENERLKDCKVYLLGWSAGTFDTDEQGRISRAAFEADPSGMVATELQNASFEVFDVNNDGYIDEEDCITRVTAIMGDFLNQILDAIKKRDDSWIMNHYGGGLIPLTSGWFLEHFTLRSNQEVLPKLDLPIYIFHGTLDMNVDVKEVYRINERFLELGKTNLVINVFEDHDHDLNYIDIIQNKGIPMGIQAILDAAANMN